MSGSDEASDTLFDGHCGMQSDEDSDELADAKAIEECNK